ncbi:S-layer homology domain-containing protein [Planococcus chinensis]|uniref:S-layer homology domain-containing protein n=1 Tax=Planococcus chinensis TaxID=272917 RepID=A0ABW4QEH5_9BACL
MKWVTALSGTVLALGLLAAPASAASDLPKSHGFYDEMTYLMELGAVSGYPDGTVQPDKIVTRAEAAIMIGKLFQFDGTPRASGFSDVTKGMKASGYIAAVREQGYINGYDDGTFRPYAPITRGDMAIILGMVYSSPEIGLNTFKDVNPNMRAYYAVSAVADSNIAAGYSDGTFKPYAKTTRGQFSAFLARAEEPKFQNDTHLANGFMRDKTKTYVYKYEDGTVSTHSYKRYTMPRIDLGFAWHDSTEEYGFYNETESRSGYEIGSPLNFTMLDLVYPYKVGTVIDAGEDYGDKLSVTGVNVTVETAYKTFTNAVEVTVEGYSEIPNSGHKFYLVPGMGQVKLVHDDGEVGVELINVK